jgi:formylglycine-generating enzyme required for sulfatase activity
MSWNFLEFLYKSGLMALAPRRFTLSARVHIASRLNMSKIFISYRRADSSAAAGRIYDRLKGYFGAGSVYMDISDHHPSDNWSMHIARALLNAKVTLVLIGDDWLSELNRRLAERDDYVRFEIKAALENNLAVLPVLIDGAAFPKKGELPRDLSQLADFQAARIRTGVDFDHDIDKLIGSIRRHLGLSWRQIGVLTLAGLGAAGLIQAYAMWRQAQIFPWIEPVKYVFYYAGGSIFAEERNRVFNDCDSAAAAPAQTASLQPDDCPNMVIVPRGAFWMGLRDAERDLLDPLERDYQDDPFFVIIRKPFAVSVHPITVGQFSRFMQGRGQKGSSGDGCMIDLGKSNWAPDAGRSYLNPFGRLLGKDDAALPVVCVSWQEADDYAHWLTKQTGDKYNYRLLTEEEWEYVVRAGGATRYPWGSESPAEVKMEAGPEEPNGAHFHVPPDRAGVLPVGRLGANRLGVEIGRGNVAEWTADCLRPGHRWWTRWTGWTERLMHSCDFHERRGSSWYNSEEFLRSGFRFLPHSESRDPMRFYDVGFRVARDITFSK